MRHPKTKAVKIARGGGALSGEKATEILALIMNEVDAEFIAKQLQPHNPTAKRVPIKSIEELERLVACGFKMRLLSFCSPLIVPRTILEAVHYNAYNFHPGPPERPGFMPAPFALHEKDAIFGVTFHRMFEKVDTGDIIDVSRFAMHDEMKQADLEIEAYKQLLMMVVKHAEKLADLDYHFTGDGTLWSGVKTTRKDLAQLIAANPGVYDGY